MNILRRAPRIKIGNTTYTFGKNGISRSTKIAKGVRIRTSANGKTSIGGSFLGWRWSQDLDELGGNKTSEEINQIREQRKNDTSLELLFTHPIVFFDHFLRRKKENKIPLNQNHSTKAYTAYVDIYKFKNMTLKKVSEGIATLENEKIIVKANVTKEIFYKDISCVHIEQGKIFISSIGRNIPLVLETVDVSNFQNELRKRMNIK